ncbi:hypothetical protein ACIHFC_28955 [Streptomyces sp. NPDC052013]|uniref:hypothetical protein n=1 Tax=Streptomyces sp. NPDC052013 TaxID=3365679 RepID=UPI0037D0FC4E
MNAARKARACHAGALAAAASSLYPATHHPYFAIPGLLSAAILTAVAASYHREASEDARVGHGQEPTVACPSCLGAPSIPRHQLDDHNRQHHPHHTAQEY